MEKADGAFLTIGELAKELGLPQHVLRYWETRFPQLTPLQRAGNRRYYRPADVSLAKRINMLLNVQGLTIKGAQRALREQPQPQADVRGSDGVQPMGIGLPFACVPNTAASPDEPTHSGEAMPGVGTPRAIDEDRGGLSSGDVALLIARLAAIRDLLDDSLS